VFVFKQLDVSHHQLPQPNPQLISAFFILNHW